MEQAPLPGGPRRLLVWPSSEGGWESIEVPTGKECPGQSQKGSMQKQAAIFKEKLTAESQAKYWSSALVRPLLGGIASLLGSPTWRAIPTCN